MTLERRRGAPRRGRRPAARHRQPGPPSRRRPGVGAAHGDGEVRGRVQACEALAAGRASTPGPPVWPCSARSGTRSSSPSRSRSGTGESERAAGQPRWHVSQHHRAEGSAAAGHGRGDHRRRPPVRPQVTGLTKVLATAEHAFEEAVREVAETTTRLWRPCRPSPATGHGAAAAPPGGSGQDQGLRRGVVTVPIGVAP